MSARNILVIDSDLLTLDAVGDAAPDGAELIRADSGEAGMALAASASVIVLNADLADGYSVCRKLKKDASLKQIPVLLTSGTATKAQFADHSKLPTRADAYLLKPFSDTDLRTVLARLLNTGGAPAPAVEPAAPTPAEPVRVAPIETDSHPPSAAPVFDLDIEEEISSPDLPAPTPEQLAAPEPAPAPRPAPSAPVRASAPQPEPAIPTEKPASQVSDLTADLLAEIETLRATNAKLTKTDSELKREISNLTERLRNSKLAAQRVEEAFGMERSRLKGEVERAKAAAEAAANAAPSSMSAEDQAELEQLRAETKRLQMLNADMQESMEIIQESLAVPMEIITRHLELETSQAAAPMALGSGD